MTDQLPATLNIHRTRGDTFPFTVTIKQGGTAVDITGYTIVMTVDPSDAPTDATGNLFSITGVLSNPTAGQVTFTLSTANANQTPGEYFHDMQYTDGSGAIRTFAKGDFTIVQDVTK